MLTALQSAGATRTEIARQRERLQRLATESSAALADLDARKRVLDEFLERRDPQVDALTVQFGRDQSRDVADHAAALDAEEWLQRDRLGRWSVQRGLESFLDQNIGRTESSLREYRNKVFGGSHRRAATETYLAAASTLEALRELRYAIVDERRRARTLYAAQLADLRAEAARALEPVLAEQRRAFASLPALFQPWEEREWERWDGGPTYTPLVAPVPAGVLRIEEDPNLGEDGALGAGVDTPLLMSLRDNVELAYDPDLRDSAIGLARSVLLRHLAAAPPGDLHLTFFDPVGLGQSVGELLDLAEYDPALVGGKVWSASSDLAGRLAEHTAHIELVIQKYLRTTYESIDDFNLEAGEVAKPYRLLVVYDFPLGFTEETVRALGSIIQNGPRCGVDTLLLRNTAIEAPHGTDAALPADSAWRIDLRQPFITTHGDYELVSRFVPEDGLVPPAVAGTIVDRVGRLAIARSEGTVTFAKSMRMFAESRRRGLRPELSGVPEHTSPQEPGTWWAGDSTRGLYAPVGQKGARDVAVLGFDSSDASGALLVGRPGSGKSTLLHAYIAGLTTVYGPDQLELHLIDFKEGVEFAGYAAEGLPHARTVAVESDREFGLSVLQSLIDELTRRGGLLRATGGRHTGLQALREATGETLPRVLLVFDEFQVLFARNDKVGIAASDLLETLIRQGRGFGIHLLLGSQSLSGLDALGAHVPQLLPTRILLAAADLDQRRVLGDHNDAGRYLTTRGQGILNTAGGAVEANERFTGALLDEAERLNLLRALRAKADAAGFTRRPVVFEGNTRARLDTLEPAAFREELAASGAMPVRLRVGAASIPSGIGDIQLRREAGAHVLAVLRDGEMDGAELEPSRGPAYALLTAAVSAAAQSAARIDVIDFLSADDGLDVTLEPLLDEGRITLRRRRAFAPLVRDTLTEIRGRVESDDGRAPARLMFLFGIHRARDLDSDLSSLDADTDLADALEEILRDGPEVGVHVWIWADSVGGVSRRLSSRMIRECGWRVAGRMSADDSHSLLGTEIAADLRDTQLVLSHDDRGLLSRVVGFEVPPASWLRALSSEQASSPTPDRRLPWSSSSSSPS